MTKYEHLLAHARWAGEVAALEEALRREDQEEADRREGGPTTYGCWTGRWRRGGYVALERALFQAVEMYELTAGGGLAVRGEGLEAVREGDRPDGRLISEPQAVLDAVRGFGEKMNVYRGASVESGVLLLKAARGLMGRGLSRRRRAATGIQG